MGRRAKSSGGEALLFLVALLGAAVVAIYRFVVENAAVIGGIVLFCGCAYLLVRAISGGTKIRPTIAAVEPPKSDIRRPKASPTSSRFRTAPARWVRRDERVRFGQTDIGGGLFYYGAGVLIGAQEATQYAINPKLSASAPRADVEGSSMPYWPSYSSISPAARRAFLDWMSGGRRDPTYGVGHVFIFFYGLEHRMFVEEADDGADLVAEVMRLLGLYGSNASFRSYATNFLRLAAAKSGVSPAPPALSPERSVGPEIDLATRLYLGEQLARSPALSAEDALRWVLAIPDAHLKTAAVRCFDEFVTLWKLRFAKRYPAGVVVKSKNRISLSYPAASGAFNVEVRGPHERYPDVAGLSKPLDAMRKMVDDCSVELDPFSRFVGRKPTLRNSMAAAGLLPVEMQRQAAGGAIVDFRRQVDALLGEQGRGSTTAQAVFEIAGMQVPSDGRINATTIDELGRALDAIDVAIEPDHRYGSSVPRADEQVFVFRAPNGGPVDARRPAFRTMRTEVEVAVLAAEADGEASFEELQRCIARIRANAELSGVEQARLIAFAVTTFNSPPKRAKVMRKLAEVGEDERRAIAKAAVTAVGDRPNVDVAEVKFLERLHKSLGLPKEDVYDGLHRAAAARPDEPVSISEERRVPGVPIPKEQLADPAPSSSGVRIDSARLARTRRETEVVSALLSDIFAEEPASPPEVAPEAPGALEGLEAPYAELVRVLELRGSMTRSEFDKHAKEMRLLPDGAIERINDWAFDRFDEALIEDGDEVVVAAHLWGRIVELRQKAA
jgi:tellurite resistance protein